METQRLAELPDDLLLKILALLPMFAETEATRLISKRWEGPWKLAPDVMFDDETFKSFETFMSFVYGSLLSNDAQILERLHLKLSRTYSASDIQFWVQIAVNRSVRELRIDLFGKTLEFPNCLSTCRTLKELTLVELCIKVVPSWFRLPSLKTLNLLSVKFSGDKSFASLLQVCPVLECLVVDNQTKDEDVKMYNIDVPTLRSLSIRYVRELRFDLFGKTLELKTCRTLKELTLHDLSIKAVPRWLRLPLLKSLHLISVKFLGAESVASFLKTCPVLECLVIEKNIYEGFKKSKIDVPTLRSLSIRSVRELMFLFKTLEFSTCRALKELTLHDLSIKAVPSSFRLPLFKTLHLFSVKFLGTAAVASFTKNFPGLECLVIEETKYEDYMMSNIDVPTLCIRSVRELKFDLFGETLELPSCLRTCRTLNELILHDLSIKFVPPCFRLPSLKSLHLLSIKFSGDESAERLLSNCPVLENLVVNKKEDDSVMIFHINVPTLWNLSIDNSRSLSIDNSKGEKRACTEEIHGFVIKAPSLMYLNIKDTFSNFIMFEFMPELIKADIEVICDQSEKFIGSLPSIQHLSLCSLTSETPYHRGSFFFHLEHLELCTCSAGWADLLACMLNDAPNLRSIKLIKKHSSSACDNDQMTRFNEPTVVPKCLSKHLEILEWIQYEGTEQELEVAKYILAKGTCLKMATFSTRHSNKYHRIRMLTKLKSMVRLPKTCQLDFNFAVVGFVYNLRISFIF